MSKQKQRIHLSNIGNNVFKYEEGNVKFMVREVVSGWQAEEYEKIDGKWEKVSVWPIPALGGIVLEVES